MINVSRVSDISSITNTYEHEHMHMSYRADICPIHTSAHSENVRMIALLDIKLLFLAHLQSVEPHFLGSCVQYLYLYSVMTQVRRFAH